MIAVWIDALGLQLGPSTKQPAAARVVGVVPPSIHSSDHPTILVPFHSLSPQYSEGTTGANERSGLANVTLLLLRSRPLHSGLQQYVYRCMQLVSDIKAATRGCLR